MNPFGIALGGLDILSGLVIFGSNAQAPVGLAILVIIYLLLKGGFFFLSSFDIACLFDIIGAVVIIFGLFLPIPTPILIIAGILVCFKGLQTLFFL